MYGPLTGTPVTAAYWNNPSGGSSAAVNVIATSNLTITSSPSIHVSGYLGGNSEGYASNTFSPSAGTIIVVTANALGGGLAVFGSSSITDSLATHLTWNKVADVSNASYAGAVAVFWAYCTSAQTSMTATVTMSTSSGINSMAVSVKLFTKASGIGQVVTGEQGVQNLSKTITPTVVGSCLFLAATNGHYATATMTAGSGCYLTDEVAGYSGGSFGQVLLGSSTSALTFSTSPFSAQTLIADSNDSSAVWVYALFEVL